MQALLLARRESGRRAASSATILRAGYAKKASEERGADSKIKKLLKLLEPAEEQPLHLSPEEQAEYQRRAKEYSRRCMQAHRQWQKDLSGRLKLKISALSALPEDLRAAALVPDLTPFPLDRMIFTDTPPQAEDKKKQADAAKKGQRRLGTKQ